MRRITRREFIRLGGAAACAAAAGPVFGRMALSQASAAIPAASGFLTPSFNAPAIVLSGADIPVTMPDSLDVAIREVWLQKKGSDARISAQLDTAAAAIKPASALEPGMHDLYATVAKGESARTEVRQNAVSVVGGFKDTYTFGIISDVHFGDPRLVTERPDLDAGKMLRKHIAMLNERGVEFCVCCGDLCFLPPKSKKELMEYMEIVAADAEFPLFTTVGNHDGYAAGNQKKVTFDPFTAVWLKSFGPLNFQSAYGPASIIGLNTYDKSAELRNMYAGLGETVDCGAMGPRQLEWLELELDKAKKSAGPSIMFGHHNPTNTIIDKNGPFEVKPFAETGRKEILSLIEKKGPDIFFVGHVHGHFEETLGKTRIVTCPATASRPADNTHPIGFMVASVKSNSIEKVEVVETARM